MSYTQAELHEILEKDFMQQEYSFAHGRTNDDVVDCMCVCFAADVDFDQFYADWLANHVEVINGEEYLHGYKLRFEKPRIDEHIERVKGWLDNKWMNEHYVRGTDDIMRFAINY